MDDRRFDELTKAFAGNVDGHLSRRRLLHGLMAGAIGFGLGTRRGVADAACPLGQVNRRGQGCVCKTTGRPPDPTTSSCGCPSGTKVCRSVCISANACCANAECAALSDQCAAGVCHKKTGLCRREPHAAGTPCSADGDACTAGDACDGAGACLAGAPRDCTSAGDACHDGVCDSVSGGCVARRKPDGTSCEDGNACTETGVCQAGVCVGGDPLVCSTDNPCLAAGCDPATGCTTTPRPAGTSCADTVRCDGGEVCDEEGNCIDGPPIVCDPCLACDPSTGQCAPDPTQEGAVCEAAPNDCFNPGVCQAATGLCSPSTYRGDGANCAAGVCFDQTCCTPEPPAATCAGVCGPQINTCGQTVQCPGLPGASCALDNECCSGVCVAGACQAGKGANGGACDSTTDCASGNCCAAVCRDLATDHGHCGACGNACAAGEVCTGGACAAGCLIGGAFVSPASVNPASACQSCQTTVSTAGWSARTGVACELGGAGGVCCADGQCCPSAFCSCCNGSICITPDLCRASGDELECR